MRVFNEFPEHRLKDPKRQAELAVYQQLEDSDAEGVALYEARPNARCKELDFGIWLTGVGRYGMQVKGGNYRTDKGAWRLITHGGEEHKGSPLKQAWDSTMGLHDHLQKKIAGSRNPVIVPVIVFPDMEPDEDIEAWAMQAGVRVLFGADDLVARLVELADTCNFFFPPTAEEVAEEVDLVMPGLGNPKPAKMPSPKTTLDMQAQHLNIQNAGVVNVYITGEGDEPPKQDPPSHE